MRTPLRPVAPGALSAGDRATSAIRELNSSGTRAGRDVFLFALVSVAVSWALWWPLAWVEVSPALHSILLAVGSFGPSISALVILRLRHGRGTARRLLSGTLRWRIPKVWWWIGILGPPTVILGGVAIASALTDLSLTWNDPSEWYLVVPVFLYVLVLGGPLGEELGWRGYALTRLQSSYRPVVAATIVGLIWALWHAPLFAIDATVQSSLPVMAFAAQILVTSFIYTWLWNRTTSLPLVVFFHASFNTSVGLFPILPQSTGGSTMPLWIGIVLGAAAVRALLLATRARLGPVDVDDRSVVVDE